MTFTNRTGSIGEWVGVLHEKLPRLAGNAGGYPGQPDGYVATALTFRTSSWLLIRGL